MALVWIRPFGDVRPPRPSGLDPPSDRNRGDHPVELGDAREDRRPFAGRKRLRGHGRGPREAGDRLADAGHSLVVIEHHLDVIKCADWIVDLGPEGGDRGGTLVAEGTPEEVAATKGSFTGAYLAPMLARSGRKPVRKVGEPETKPGKKPAPKPAPKPSKPAKPPAKKAPARTKAAR